MTLIELMVALAIGSFLMIGAVTVFMQSRSTFRVNEAVARLQENARFVLDAIEPDVRMASYFGLTTRSWRVDGRATPMQAAAFAVAGDCGVNWSVFLDAEVDGTNNAYAWACAPFGAAQAGADTLVVRRVVEEPEAVLQNNVLYVQSARGDPGGRIFTGTAIPAGFLAATSEAHRLVANGYYVDQTSTLDTPGNAVPSLRVKTLTGSPLLGVRVVDQEVLPGVEDMQIQFGIDTDIPDSPERGSIDRYVNPGDPLVNPVLNPNTEILAVRIWLRLRAEQRDIGFTDTTNYVYADQNIAPLNDQFRRVVVSKTIYLRNARPPI
jgi:type IV pilus assembly protein PilW